MMKDKIFFLNQNVKGLVMSLKMSTGLHRTIRRAMALSLLLTCTAYFGSWTYEFLYGESRAMEFSYQLEDASEISNLQVLLGVPKVGMDSLHENTVVLFGIFFLFMCGTAILEIGNYKVLHKLLKR